ncbi:hypothetical protein PT286_06540 [Neisseriaceae bacterium ESL0693]|nr:hypothetical protein [Neisseriaceae bacterium ESL0693]
MINRVTPRPSVAATLAYLIHGTLSLSEFRHSPRNSGSSATHHPKKQSISPFFDGTDSHEKADSAVTGQTPPTEDEIRQYSKQAQQAALLDAYMYPRTTNVARL